MPPARSSAVTRLGEKVWQNHLDKDNPMLKNWWTLRISMLIAPCCTSDMWPAKQVSNENKTPLLQVHLARLSAALQVGLQSPGVGWTDAQKKTLVALTCFNLVTMYSIKSRYWSRAWDKCGNYRWCFINMDHSDGSTCGIFSQRSGHERWSLVILSVVPTQCFNERMWNVLDLLLKISAA